MEMYATSETGDVNSRVIPEAAEKGKPEPQELSSSVEVRGRGGLVLCSRKCQACQVARGSLGAVQEKVPDQASCNLVVVTVPL